MSIIQEIEAMVGAVKNESDRGCALILAANIDNRLRDILEKFFICMPKGESEKLFERGVLSNLAAKNRVAYACGLLTKNEFEDISKIIKVRNYFAHKEHGWDFNKKEVKEVCDKFEMIKEMQREYPEFAKNIARYRDKFQITAVSIIWLLENQKKKAKGEKRTSPALTSILPK